MSANAHIHHKIFNSPTTKGGNQIGMYLMMSWDIHKCEEEDDLDSQDDDGEGDEDTGDDEDPDLATQQRTISDTDFAMLLS